jgi:hypothetical protein
MAERIAKGEKMSAASADIQDRASRRQIKLKPDRELRLLREPLRDVGLCCTARLREPRGPI